MGLYGALEGFFMGVLWGWIGLGFGVGVQGFGF